MAAMVGGSERSHPLGRLRASRARAFVAAKSASADAGAPREREKGRRGVTRDWALAQSSYCSQPNLHNSSYASVISVEFRSGFRPCTRFTISSLVWPAERLLTK